MHVVGLQISCVCVFMSSVYLNVKVCVCVQVYYCRSLALAYIEHTCLQRFHELTTNQDTPAGLRPVLRKLCALYGLWSLSSHMATLYQGM